jgi:hypothetical protein
MSPGGVHENLEETKLIVGVCFWVASHNLNEEFAVTWKDAALCLLTDLVSHFYRFDLLVPSANQN